jgi:hypothetical protein
LIFLDESGVSTQMTRRYARAPRGVRVHETTPEGNWKILTILGAMSVRGMIATMTIEAATDAEIFLAYLDHVLCPALRPGDVVVMDNLSSHKVAGVRERIEAVGAELLYPRPTTVAMQLPLDTSSSISFRIAAMFTFRLLSSTKMPAHTRSMSSSLSITSPGR